MNSPKTKFTIYLPILFALVLIIGMLLGSKLSPVSSSDKKLFTFDMNRYDKVSDVLNYISKEYVDSINKNELSEDAIVGMLDKLDPHSQYISAEEFNEVNDPLLGNFEGIGIQFRIEKDTIVVIHTIIGGPSEKVGLMAGDRIVRIEGDTIAGTGVRNKDAMKLLKGKKGTQVKVSIFRRGVDDLIDFIITRDVIPTYSIDISYMVNDSIGYIKLSKFSATTYKEFVHSATDLKQKGMQTLILDLRGNVGGYLQAAIRLADEFLEKDKLIVYTEGASRPNNYFYASNKGRLEDSDIVVLIDEGSASASEIIAGAIQDNDRGLVIGRRSFGKGLVQEQLDLLDGSAIRLTVARYHTPTGRCIQKSYEEGVEEYYMESYHRYINGEMDNPDSIQFADSLKYTTPGGKTVYGGGGIMPDIYVPIERDSSLDYYHDLLNKGLIFRFAFEYTDSHRKELGRYNSVEAYEHDFSIMHSTMNDFVSYAEENGVKRDPAGIAYADERIRILLKAFIGRNLLDDKGFYPIYHKTDRIFLRTMQLLSETPSALSYMQLN